MAGQWRGSGSDDDQAKAASRVISTPVSAFETGHAAFAEEATDMRRVGVVALRSGTADQTTRASIWTSTVSP